MQRVCAIVAVMVVIASPAFAQSAARRKSNVLCSRRRTVLMAATTRYTDPDPNIQFEIWDDGMGGIVGGRFVLPHPAFSPAPAPLW